MPTDHAEPELVTPAAAARLLGVSRSTLVRMNEQDEIKSTRTRGGHRRYALDEIERVRQEWNR